MSEDHYDNNNERNDDDNDDGDDLKQSVIYDVINPPSIFIKLCF